MCSYTKTINDKLCSVDPQSASLLRNCSARRLDFLASNAYPSDGAASYARFDVARDRPKPTAAAFDGGETGDGFAAPARWRSLAGPSRLASELKSAWLKLTIADRAALATLTTNLRCDG
ncbi:hypothetical protein JL720_3708 [Aureococcus anophagefferens]|nr:hypothetical protein JL720_3708 [Aureococcus anophagefferens]